MADIRIKDLTTTAAASSADDYIAVDGTSNGTRKLSAATPSFATSVTVPGVVGPTSTDLTLTGGSTGASLVLGQGATAGNATILPKGTGSIGLNTSSATLYGKVAVALATATSPATVNTSGFDGTYVTFGGVTNSGYSTFGIGVTAAGTTGTNLISAAPGNDWLDINYYGLGHKFYSFGAEKSRFTSTGNLLIGTTTDAASLAGGLVVNGSGAGAAASSTITGALRVTGGVGVSGAGYFGGVLASQGPTGLPSQVGGQIVFSGNDTSATNRIFYGDGSGYSLKFATRVTGATTDRMTLTDGGVLSIASTSGSVGSTSGALQVAGGIYAGAASVFATTGTTTFGATNQVSQNVLIGASNVSSGAALYAGLSQQLNYGYGLIGYNITGTPGSDSYTSPKSTTGGSAIEFQGSSGVMRFLYHTGATTGGNTVAVTEAMRFNNGAATFAGAVTTQTGGFRSSGSLTLGAAFASIGAGFQIDYTAPVTTQFFGDGTGYSMVWASRSASTTTTRMTLTDAGALTVTGAVSIGNTVSSVSPTSPNRTITIVVGGVTLYIAAKTTND